MTPRMVWYRYTKIFGLWNQAAALWRYAIFGLVTAGLLFAFVYPWVLLVKTLLKGM